MARIDGHGPKPTVAFIDDWSELKKAVAFLESTARDEFPLTVPGGMNTQKAAQAVITYVPMLMDAYSEAWELMNQMMQAWEKLQESKDSIYVPDAQELVSGLANPGRTKR